MERNKKKIQIDISGEKCQQHKVAVVSLKMAKRIG